VLSVHTSPLEQPGGGDSGGMTVYLLSLARQMSAAGIETDIFTRAASAGLPSSVTLGEGLRVHHMESVPPGLGKHDLVSYLGAFYLAFAAHPATAALELVHGHYWMGGWVGRHAQRRLGLPLVQSFHTLARAKNQGLPPGDVPEPALRLAAEDRVAADADAVIASSPAEAALLRARYATRPGRVHLVEPGVDLDLFRPPDDRQRTRETLGGGPLVLFVGRLQPLKGPDLAVRTLAELDRRLPRDGRYARMILVGGVSANGSGTVDPPALRRLARDLGVADRVTLLAPRPQPELAGLYRAADAVLIPSYSEAYGLVALEAQACGTPVVAAAVGGLPYALADGGGTVVDSHDPVAFATALLPFLTDARTRAAAAGAARRRALRASWERTAQRVLSVYRAVLSGCPREQPGHGRTDRGCGT
jgi:D-inositol-3-phosphate glycosyltransferase